MFACEKCKYINHNIICIDCMESLVREEEAIKKKIADNKLITTTLSQMIVDYSRKNAPVITSEYLWSTVIRLSE